MSIHHTLFFSDPINYVPGRVKRHGASVIVNEMTDNSYRTHATETDIDVDIRDRTGVATGVTHIFLKYRGHLRRYVATPNSGAPVTRTVPTEVTNWEGNTVSLEVDGFKHDLFELSAKMTAESVRLQFTGANLEIYALMLLEQGLEIHANRDWSRIHPVKVDRTGVLHQNTGGGLYRDAPIGAEREKWEYDLTLLSIEGTTEILYKDFLRWKAAHPNCAFSREFTRFPDEVMLVTFPQLATRIQPRSDQYKGAGDRVPLRIAER